MVEAETYIRQIDPTRLEAAVAKLVGKETVRMAEWTAMPIHGGLDRNNCLIRCQGHILDGGKRLPWSLVIKITVRVADNDDPAGYQYWKREALVYQTLLSDRLPEDLSAPRCLGVDEAGTDTVWIWMEDLLDDHGGTWGLEAFGQAAHQLGRFNGAFLAGRPLPAETWLAKKFLHNYVERAAPMIAFIRNNPQHELVRSLYGSNLPLILAMWEIRGDLLDILEGMPQVFCHQDAFRRNLFLQQGRLMAIDWGFCGNAPAGSELVPLIVVALSLNEIPYSRSKEFEQLCLDSYMKGLREAGAQVSARSVRRSFVLSILLRYVFGGNIGDILPALLDENRRTWLAENIGEPIEKTSTTSAEESGYFVSVFVRSLQLMGLRLLLKVIGYAIRYSLAGIIK
jgi:hypothetical protein